MSKTDSSPLTLLAGPEIRWPDLRLESWLIGRGVDCDLILPDAAISRHHARIDWSEPASLTDLGSAAGVRINGRPSRSATLAAGDRLELGPWQFLVRNKATDEPAETLVEAVSSAALAAPRLDLLLDFCRQINQSQNDDALIRSLLEVALRGSGFRRALLIDVSEPELAILASDPPGLDDRHVSRQLVDGCRSGQLMQLKHIATPDRSASVVALQLTSAIAVSIDVDGLGTLCLYLDSRVGESAEQPDTARYCQALLRIGALGLARLAHQRQLWQQREQIYADLHDDLGARLLNQIYRANDPAQADEARAMLQDLRDVVSRPLSGRQTISEMLAGMRSEAAARCEAAAIRLDWRQPESLPGIDWDIARATKLSRCLREAISNAIAHARPSRLSIEVICKNRQLIISLGHDGEFSPPDQWTAGRGTRSLKHRCLELGGVAHWSLDDATLVTRLSAAVSPEP